MYLPNAARFSTVFHCQAQQSICNEVITVRFHHILHVMLHDLVKYVASFRLRVASFLHHTIGLLLCEDSSVPPPLERQQMTCWGRSTFSDSRHVHSNQWLQQCH